MKLSTLGAHTFEDAEKPLPGADRLCRRDLARDEKLQRTLGKGALEERFLPKELQGKEVLLKEGDLWRADNRLLRAETQGLTFRSTKGLEDTAKLDLVLPWGTLVSADDDGNGWVKVNAEGYLSVIAACDRALGSPHFMQMRKTLKRIGACEEAMEALRIWKMQERDPPLRYTQIGPLQGRSSLKKIPAEGLQRQTVRELKREGGGSDSTTKTNGRSSHGAYKLDSSRPGTAGSSRSFAEVSHYGEGSSQSTRASSRQTPSLVPPRVGRLDKT